MVARVLMHEFDRLIFFFGGGVFLLKLQEQVGFNVVLKCLGMHRSWDLEIINYRCFPVHGAQTLAC